MNHLTPKDLGGKFMEYDLTEPSEDTAVVVKHSSLQRGDVTLFLPPGLSFEFANDEPSATVIAPVPEDRDPVEVAEGL